MNIEINSHNHTHTNGQQKNPNENSTTDRNGRLISPTQTKHTIEADSLVSFSVMCMAYSKFRFLLKKSPLSIQSAVEPSFFFRSDTRIAF